MPARTFTGTDSAPRLLTEWRQDLRRVIDLRHRATLATLNAFRPRVQDAMQADAPWLDRTGDARAGLRATVDWDRAGPRAVYHLRLQSTVAYGKWLETHKGPAYGHRAGMSLRALEDPANAGPLAIVEPTRQHFAPIIRREIAQARRRAGPAR